MSNITLSVPNEIHEVMKKHNEIRWSEIARRAIVREVERLSFMDKIAAKSKLTMKDIEEINNKVKESLHRRYAE
ncbi:MAG TPA: hypothetical protein VJH20_02225 [Candidatus Nanoarchaeia archaeon]|nr:hypothetical protein [Candidatus Nanoarchaeia archaeon]